MESTRTAARRERPQKSGAQSTRHTTTSEPLDPALSSPAYFVGKRNRDSRPEEIQQRSPPAAIIHQHMAFAPGATYAPPVPSPGSKVHQHDGAPPAGTTNSDLPSPSRHRPKEPQDEKPRGPSPTVVQHAPPAPSPASRAHHSKGSTSAGTSDNMVPSASRHRRKEPSDGGSREPSAAVAPHVSLGPYRGTGAHRNDGSSSAGTADSGSQSASRHRREQPSDGGSQGPSTTAAEQRERKRKLRAQNDETKEPFWEYVCIAACVIFVSAIVVGFAIISTLNSKKRVRVHRIVLNETVSPRSSSPPSLYFTR